eukprot:scaffold181108_cov32-Prasinocladus_malaysianus.AAC.3
MKNKCIVSTTLTQHVCRLLAGQRLCDSLPFVGRGRRQTQLAGYQAGTGRDLLHSARMSVCFSAFELESDTRKVMWVRGVYGHALVSLIATQILI